MAAARRLGACHDCQRLGGQCRALCAGGGNASALAVAAQRSDDGSRLVLQLVNGAMAAAPMSIRLGDASWAPAGPVTVTTLAQPGQAPPDPLAANTPARPTFISPAAANASWPSGSGGLELTLPAFSFTVIEVHGGAA